MLPKGLEVVGRTKLAIDEMTKWAREEFNIPSFAVEFKLTRRSDRGWCRMTHKGPYIHLGVKSLMEKQPLAMVEYKSYNYYLEVGGFKTDDWRLHHDCVIAHEMSHAVQFWLIKQAAREAGSYSLRGRFHVPGLGYTETGHGAFFLAIYKRFRQRFINSRVPREAYCNPRKAFAEDEVKLEQVTANDPLKGVRVVFSGGKHFEVIGKDPSIRGMYNYRAKNLRTGQLTRLKLTDIMMCSEEAKARLAGNENLMEESLIAALKQESRARATATRRARRRLSW